MAGGEASVLVGVVVERRAIDHPWAEHAWHAVAVLPDAPEVEPWRPIAEGPGWTRYHAGRLALELHRRETDAYRLNLEAPRPSVFVVLRRDPAGGRPQAITVTVSPSEAESYLVSGEELVDAVAMPPAIAALLGRFVAEHHVEEPFVKRQRKPHGPRAADGPPPRKGSVKGPRYG